MKVCVVAEYYPRRRDPVLGVWAHRQALAARDAGADVRVLVLERPVPQAAAARSALRGRPGPLAGELRGMVSQPRRDVLDGIEVEYVRFFSPPRDGSYANWGSYAARPLGRALGRLRESWEFDLIHAHYAIPAGAAASNFASEHRLPLVVSVHGGDVLGPALAAPAARARVGDVLRRSARVLCNSAGTLRRAAALVGDAQRMEVVHLGANAPDDPPPKRAEPTVSTLGHVVGRKRHEDVLRALPHAAETIPDLRWVVIGDGPEVPRLRSLAGELGVADRVEWLGQLPPDDALCELARTHVMALPSANEAFGVAYVEALAAGVPAIGAQGEDGPEEIASLGTGMVLVPAEQPEQLAATVTDLLENRDRLAELSAGARRTAEACFSWRACGQKTVQAYERALR